jgi:uncharacterized caspase-like protein
MSNRTGPFTHGYALLIGVGESAYPPLSLPVTVRDTQTIRAALIEPELGAYLDDTNHIKVLNNAGATRAAILDGLNWLKDQSATDQKATIIIYYSGHGWLNKVDNGYYLLPYDVKPAKLAATSLSAKTFTASIQQIQAERLLVIIDSCHAAGMATAKGTKISQMDDELMKEFDTFQRASPPKGMIDSLKWGKGRVVFTSSDGTQSSWIRPDQTNSIYTYHLLEALQGADNQPGDIEVRVSNLMHYLSRSVPISVNKWYQEDQTPQFDMSGGDFVVAKLRGDKGLPAQGWEAIKTEATQTIHQIAQNIHQHGKYITNIQQAEGIHIGDVYNQ